MRYSPVIVSLLVASATTTSLAASDSQSLGIYIPKVTLVSVDPPIPFDFKDNATVATGSSKLAISSNVPEAYLQIRASGVTLNLSSDTIQCPPGSSSVITCRVGIKLVKNGTLNFTATRTNKNIEPQISYTMFP